MAKPQQDNMGEVFLAMDSLARRTAWMEKAFVDEEDDLQQRDVHVQGIQKQIDFHILSVRAETALLKRRLAALDEEFTRLTFALKQSVKKDELERLSARVDRLGMERVLSKRGMTRELDEIEHDVQDAEESASQAENG